MTLLFVFLVGVAAVSARAPSVQAAFDPPVLSVGQNGAYTVTFTNVREMPSLPTPQVDGLLFSDTPSVSQRSSWVNGVSTQELGLSWRVVAQQEGTFTAPDRTVSVGGTTLSVPSARLRVVPMSEREQGMFQLRWDLPEKTFYVGEAIPAFLRLAMREGLEVRVPALPEKLGDGFVITPFTDQVAQEREMIDGVPYRVYIWSVVITPIRAGDLTLETALTVIYGDPYNTRFGADTFGFRRVREQQRRLSTGELAYRIEEPPADGRLPGFNGAIGNFTVEPTLGREEVRAGEPLTLTLRLTGSGNFERVPAPSLPDAPGWRTYPPRVQFQPENERGLRGTKTFEYLLIPETEEISETPPIAFSVFNPYTERYEDLSVDPRPLTVTPAPPSAVSERTVYGGRALEAPAEVSRSWRPNRADLGRVIPGGIRPIFLSPVFWSAQGIVAAAFMLTFFWQKRRYRLEHDAEFARRVVGSRSVRHWMREAGEATKQADANRFYSAAQRAIQESTGRRFPRGRKPESLTLAEIEETLREQGVSETCRADVTHLFQTGDALKYAGSSAPSEQLKTDADRLFATLRELHKALA